MAARNVSPVALYKPQVGEVVRDKAHRGAEGVFMGMLAGRAYLRPVGGGVEWDTCPDEIEPASDVAKLIPVVKRSKPRRVPDGPLPGAV